jgi:CheY-like chemotaxis protein
MALVQKHKVLIVEDEHVLALDLKWTLERLGYKVLATVGSGAAALRAVESHVPDIVLMDLQLHGPMDGAATALELRRRCEFTLVLVSASVPLDGQALSDPLQVGDPAAWLPKPFTTADLEAVMSTACRAHRAKHS